MVDLIALHEIGHAQVYACGLDAKQHWFNEFLASYFACGYMRSREPEMAVVWDAVMRQTARRISPPTARSRSVEAAGEPRRCRARESVSCCRAYDVVALHGREAVKEPDS